MAEPSLPFENSVPFDIEPDRQDPDRFEVLWRTFAIYATGLVDWESVMRKLSRGLLRIYEEEFDRISATVERVEQMSQALVAHWLGTLGELAENNKEVELSSNLWPTPLAESHRIEYQELLNQFGLSVEQVSRVWNAYGHYLFKMNVRYPIIGRLALLRTHDYRIIVVRTDS